MKTAITIILGLFVAWSAAAATVMPADAPIPTNPPVVLAWNVPTDPIVAGVYIYMGTTSRLYTNRINAGTNNSISVPYPADGTADYWAATTYSLSGEESALSAEVSLTNYLYTLTNNYVRVGTNGVTMLATNNPPGLDTFYSISNGHLLTMSKPNQSYFGAATNKSFVNLWITNTPQYKRTP